jgi:hypothetical protein
VYLLPEIIERLWKAWLSNTRPDNSIEAKSEECVRVESDNANNEMSKSKNSGRLEGK